MEHDIAKALEVWILQNMLDASIMAGFVALGIALIENYRLKLEGMLTLRVSTEIWKVGTVLIVDILLAAMVLAGLFMINPDIMADVKMALPFYPLATLLTTLALVLRLFKGGHTRGTPTYSRALCLLFWANIINLAGFTFVMEAPGSEYLSLHPNAVWSWISSHLCSKAGPAGLELAQLSFWIFFPLIALVLLWGFAPALKSLKSAGDESP